jgi:hypothetical protein
MLRWPKKGSTLVSHRFYQLHGAEILAYRCFYLADQAHQMYSSRQLSFFVSTAELRRHHGLGCNAAVARR